MEQYFQEHRSRDSGEQPIIAESLIDVGEERSLIDVSAQSDRVSLISLSDSLENHRPHTEEAKQPIQDTCVGILRRVSLALALGYARWVGGSVQVKCDLLRERLARGVTSHFETQCGSLGLTPEQFMAHIPEGEQIAVFTALDENLIFEESQRALILSDIITRGGFGIEEIPGLLGEVDRLTAEVLVAQMQHCHPLIALKHADSLDKWFAFDRAKIVEALIEREPLVLLSDTDVQRQVTPPERVRAAEAVCDSDPRAILDGIDTFDLEPEWLAQHFKERILVDPAPIIAHLGAIGAYSSLLRTELVQILEHEKPEAVLDHMQDNTELVVSEILPSVTSAELASEIAKSLVKQGNHKIFLESISAFEVLDQAKRREFVLEFERVNPYECYEAIEGLLTWAGDTNLTLANSETSVRFWRRLTRLRSQIGHGDSEQIRDILVRRALSHPAKVWEHLDELGISLSPWRGQVAQALSQNFPEKCIELLERLNIDEPSDASQLVERYCLTHPGAARKWLRERAHLLPEGLRAAIEVAEILVKPWESLGRLVNGNPPDETSIVRVAIECARDNTARAFRELPRVLAEFPNARTRVFATCAEKKLWQTLEAFPEFGISLSDVEQVLQRAFAQDPVRALKASCRYLAQDPQLLRAGLRGAIRKNAAQSLEILRRLDLSLEESLPFLQQALRRNPRLFQADNNLLLSQLKARYLPALIAAACKGNIRRASELLEQSARHPEHSVDLVVRACALENYNKALESAPQRIQQTLKEPAFLEQLSGQAIVTGRWSSALQVCRLLAQMRSGSGEEVEQISLTKALEILDATLSSLESRQDLSIAERENVRLMRVIRQANCIPTDTIQSVFDHFGEDDYQYLISVFERGGSSVAEAFFDTLLKVYPFEADISKLDQTIIDQCLIHGFRGLSSEMLSRLRGIFKSSFVRGRQAIQGYHNVASRILDGKTIPSELIEPVLFPSLVHAAYRPVGMTVHDVASILESIPDHSQHLSGFRFPSGGYPVRLATEVEVSLKEGVALTKDVFSNIARIVAPDATREMSLTPAVLFKRMLEGGFDQIDLSDAWSLLSTHSSDERITTLKRQILTGVRPGASLKQQLQSLAYSRELFSVVTRDALLTVAEQTLAAEGANRLRMSPKLENAVRRVLKMTADQPVETPEILSALEAQTEKLFKSVQQSIVREARKFSQSFEQIGEQFVLYLSKNKASYFGRAGAGLCTSQENWSWNQPSFLQMVMVDKGRGQVVGNIQLHLFTNREGKRSILARLNPTSSFLTGVSAAILAKEMLRAVQTFADENQLIPYLPVQTGWHELTNRDSFAPSLQRYAGAQESATVKLTATKTVHSVLRMRRVGE